MEWGSRKTSRQHSKLWARRAWILAGYSFGAWVNALGLAKFEEAQRLIMVSPPVSAIDFSFLEHCPKIKLVICGSRDEIAEYKKVEEMLPKWNDQALFRVIQGADHFFSGYEEDLIDIVGEFLREMQMPLDCSGPAAKVR